MKQGATARTRLLQILEELEALAERFEQHGRNEEARATRQLSKRLEELNEVEQTHAAEE